MNWSRRVLLAVVPVVCALVAVQVASAWNPALEKREAMMAMKGGPASGKGIVKNFRVLGNNDLGMTDVNGDVWVHGNFAYVGTWAIPAPAQVYEFSTSRTCVGRS